jgi:hypothetical protein
LQSSYTTTLDKITPRATPRTEIIEHDIHRGMRAYQHPKLPPYASIAAIFFPFLEEVTSRSSDRGT